MAIDIWSFFDTEANGRPPPIKVPDGEALIKKGEHLDDFVEDVEEDDVEDPNRDQLTLIIDDVPEVEHMGDLYIPLSERMRYFKYTSW